jgi:FkbM family methyltransferase
MNLLKNIFRSVRLPIQRGPNRGRWWSVSTAKNYFYDRFVPGKAGCLPQLLQPGETVWDIGAHCGYTALVEAQAVGATGRCFAFEPNPRNRQLLQLHLQWNRTTNVTVLPYAISGADGELSFGWEENQRASTISSHLGGAGWKVPVRTIDGLIQSGEIPAPTFLKIDVEGAELELLQGAAQLLARELNLGLILSTHSAALHEACAQLLRAAGFNIIETSAVALARTTGWAALGDVDLLAYRSGRRVSPAARAAFAAIGRHG